MLTRRGALALSTLVLTSSVALPALATVVVEIPMEELVADADVIVHGSVLRSGAQLETFDGRLEPHTITDLRVIDWLAGSGGEVLTIDEIGGEVNGSGRWIDGTPRYAPREEVIVFLRRLPSGAYRTVGMAQGRFDVVHSIAPSAGTSATWVERDTSTLAFASWVRGQMQIRDGGRSPSVDYDTFVGFIRSVVEQLALPGATSTTGAAR